jgi:hypothetical protein
LWHKTRIRVQISFLAKSAMDLANVREPVTVPRGRAGGCALVWFHRLEELILQPEPDIELPAM